MKRLPAPADAVRWWPSDAAGALALQAPRGIRAAVDRADAALTQALRDGEPIERIVALRGWVIEQAVLLLWQRAVGSRGAIALMAVGGFGRGELHPRSDVDLLVLVAGPRDAETAAALEQFFASVWDEGLAVGHAVRSVSECEDAARADLTVFTNLTENRLIAGSHDLHAQMLRVLEPHNMWPADAYAAGKRAEQQARRARFNDTAYNLEPNIKEGPGGLRDLQTVCWIALRQQGLGSLEALRDARLLSLEEYDALVAARRSLWRIRYALHVVARRAEERLLFEHQRDLAQWFGLRDEHAQNLAVEQFMQGYYRAAMVVEKLNERLQQRLEELRDAPSGVLVEPIDEEFVAAGGFLDLRDPHLFERHPAAILRAFRVLLDRPQVRGLRSTLLARLDSVLPGLDDGFRNDPEANAAFLGIIRHPGAVAEVLQKMSRYGVLGRLLPAFGKVAGRMQYDLFHAYTVDQHTLFVIRNIRQYADAATTSTLPLAHELYARLRKPELLLLAGIFHDIAKGRGGDHSEIGEVDAREFCARVGLSAPDTDLVGWLVRQHLIMSITAQKQDIADPRVVHRFAGVVADIERLDHLYLLTVADIRATSPKLWNSWKDRLLAELYQAAHYVLARGLEHPVHGGERMGESRAAALEILVAAGVDPDRIESLWAEFPQDSFLRYTPDQIAWQTRSILAAGRALPVISVRRATERGTTELFVYSEDRDGLFATITAALDRMQLNVVEARIVTSGAGHTLDTFALLDANGAPLIDSARENQIVARLRDALSHEVLNLRPARRAATRQQKQFHVPLRMEFDFSPAGRTQLALVCSDRPGLLAHVAAALRECQLRVHDARIATFGERVEDFFELTDQDDRALNATQLDTLREALRRHIETSTGAGGAESRHDIQHA